MIITPTDLGSASFTSNDGSSATAKRVRVGRLHRPAMGRLAVELAGTSPSLQVGLSRQETIAFDTARVPVSVRVLEGSIWLTDDANDRILTAGQTVDCPPMRRVVISGLSSTRLDVSVGELHKLPARRDFVGPAHVQMRLVTGQTQSIVLPPVPRGARANGRPPRARDDGGAPR